MVLYTVQRVELSRTARASRARRARARARPERPAGLRCAAAAGSGSGTSRPRRGGAPRRCARREPDRGAQVRRRRRRLARLQQVERARRPARGRSASARRSRRATSGRVDSASVSPASVTTHVARARERVDAVVGVARMAEHGLVLLEETLDMRRVEQAYPGAPASGSQADAGSAAALDVGLGKGVGRRGVVEQHEQSGARIGDRAPAGGERPHAPGHGLERQLGHGPMVASPDARSARQLPPRRPASPASRGPRAASAQTAAIALAEAGCDIVHIDRRDPAETRAAIEALGRRSALVELDLEARGRRRLRARDRGRRGGVRATRRARQLGGRDRARRRCSTSAPTRR